MDWHMWTSLPLVERLGWTLLHFLWQGAAAALVLAVLLMLLSRRSAQARYTTALVMLAVMLLLPATTFIILGNPSRAPARDYPVPLTYGDVAIGEPAVSLGERVEGTRRDVSDPAPTPTNSAREGLSIPPRVVAHALPWLVAGWLTGAFMLTLRHVGSWLIVRRLRRRHLSEAPAVLQQMVARLAERSGLRRAVRVCESALVEVPCVLGWLRPVLLLPAGLLTGLTPRQLEAILAHELAHIRRHDALVNLLQMLAETLLFYHPAVWWVSRRLRIERELCCDEFAVGLTGDAHGFARALTRLEELRTEPSAYVLALDGGSLMFRIQCLLGVRRQECIAARVVTGALCSLSLVALITWLVVPQPAIAQAQTGQPAVDLRSHPGFIEFDLTKLAGGATPNVNISLNKTQLKMMLAAVENMETSPSQISGLLDGINLDMVKLQVFEGAAIDMASVTGTVNNLVASGWSSTLRVMEDNESVNILMHIDGDNINGLGGVIADGPGDLVLFNIVGTNPAEQLGAKIGQGMRLVSSGQLDIEQLLGQAMGQGVYTGNASAEQTDTAGMTPTAEPAPALAED